MTGIPLALLPGAAAGLGLAAIVWWLTPLAPDPVSAYARRRAVIGGPVVATPRSRREALLSPLAVRLGVSRFSSDLALLGQEPTELVTRKLGYGAVGLVFPPLLAAGMATLGLRLPLPVPVLAGVLLAVVLFLLPDLEVRHRAEQAREDLRFDLCVYLELVALERASDAGAGEALERAAAVGDSRLFVLVREDLVRVQLAGEPPWRAFERLAARVGVVEVADLADIMRLTGEDGAAVYGTVRARAASLRSTLLSAQAARANAASEQMVVPVALLGLAFLLLLGYPAFARIVFG